jgi:hypothetical protein
MRPSIEAVARDMPHYKRAIEIIEREGLEAEKFDDWTPQQFLLFAEAFYGDGEARDV